MFLGEYEYSCDEKNRIRIPNKFRRDLNGEFILTKGNDGCIFILPKNYFDSILEKTSNLPMFDSTAQRPLRLLFSSACEVKEDKQGRFLLPSLLKTFAGINKDVVLVGAGSRVELWARDKWLDYINDTGKDLDDLLQGLGKYGI